MRIVWTKHAEDRQRQWERVLGITRDEIEQLLARPEQITPGDGDVLVAQARRGPGLIRVPFVSEKDGRRVLTVYWTSRIEKYWREQQDEDAVRP